MIANKYWDIRYKRRRLLLSSIPINETGCWCGPVCLVFSAVTVPLWGWHLLELVWLTASKRRKKKVTVHSFQFGQTLKINCAWTTDVLTLSVNCRDIFFIFISRCFYGNGESQGIVTDWGTGCVWDFCPGCGCLFSAPKVGFVCVHLIERKSKLLLCCAGATVNEWPGFTNQALKPVRTCLCETWKATVKLQDD